MKSTLLKFIIITAFIGVVLVIVASLVLNSTAQEDAFKEISAAQKTVNFEKFVTEGKTISRSYLGAVDLYSVHVCDEIAILQEEIIINISILKLATDLTRTEKNNLVELHDKYITQMKSAQKALKSYFDNNAKTGVSVPALSAEFVRETNKAFKSGIAFYKELNKITNSKVFKGKAVKDYNQIIREIAIIYGEKSVNYVERGMISRWTGYGESPVHSDSAANNFKEIIAHRSIYSAATEMLNPVLIKFIKDYNAISFKKLVSDSDYYSSLNTADKASASNVRIFLSTYFDLDTSVIKGA